MPASTTRPDRERVVAVAAELFAHHGYEGTAMADLAKAVGVDRDELHRYVESKEALLHAIIREQAQRLVAQAEAVLATGLGPEELLRELARGLLREAGGPRWTVFLRDHPALTGRRRDEVLAARARYAGCWQQALDRGASTGALRPASPLLVTGLLAMFGSAHLWSAPGIPPDELVEGCVEALLAGLRSPASPTAGATSVSAPGSTG